MVKHQTNGLSAIKQILTSYNIHFDYDNVKNDFLGHPEYPSLYSIHQILSKYGLKNIPIEAEFDFLATLNAPFIAHMELPNFGKDFVFVKQITNSYISYKNGNGNIKKMNLTEFKSIWNGIAIIPEAQNISSTKINQHIKINWSTSILISLLFIFLSILTISSTNALQFTTWGILHISGLIITVLLLLYDLDPNTRIGQQFCATTQKINCEAVLHNKAARIGNFTWSEIGFTYFSGGLIYLIICANRPHLFSPLIILSILALPYIFYSIYFQLKVIRQWCKLCLLILGILLLEGTLGIYTAFTISRNPKTTIDWYNVFLLMITIPIPLIIWKKVKLFILNILQFDQYKFAYYRLLNNKDVFTSFLIKQKKAKPVSENNSIIIGNPKATTELIKVCNPFCKPCAKAHLILEEILNANDDVKIKIVFATSGSNYEEKKKIAAHLVTVWLENNEIKTKQALHFWYKNEKKTYDELREKYPITENPESQVIISEMDKWQKEMGIRFTPTIFVNEYILPKEYTLDSLKFSLTF